MDIESLKLISSTLTPITVGVLGYFINRTLSKQNQKQDENKTLIEKRMSLYEEMAQPLNNIYCFINDVGSYKELSPELVIKNKRDCDLLFHIYRPIWDRDVIDAYKDFMNSSFSMFSRSGDDARVRTISDEKKNTESWNDTWLLDITNERDSNYHQKYIKLLNTVARNLRFSGVT